MYQVIHLRGDMEPWWFLEGWEKDITTVVEFDNYYKALKYYKAEWRKLYRELPSFISKSSIMTAFWDSKDKRWCEACDDYLQQYHSLILLVDWQKIPKNRYRTGYTKRNDPLPPPFCSVKKWRFNKNI